jgi:hypothetical protein
MTKWLSGVIPVIAAGSLAQAGTTGDDWLTLDEEIDRLASSSAVQTPGPSIGALIRPLFLMDDGDDVAPDISGFDLDQADIWAEGSLGNTDWRISTDLESGEASLEDAYAIVCVAEQVGLTFGQYRNPMLHSGRLDPEQQMLIARTRISQFFDSFDQGAMVDIGAGQFGGYFSVQNGIDGLENTHSYMARLEVLLNQTINVRNWAKRVSVQPPDGGMVIGVFHYEDDITSDVQFNGADFAASFNNWRVEAEVVDFDIDLPGNDGATPWDIGGQFMVNQNFDIAARYEDSDDDLTDTSNATVGLDYYPGDPSVYWSIEVDLVDSEDDAIDGEVFRVGLTVGGSRTRP